jgi:predicted transcriptional regulator
MEIIIKKSFEDLIREGYIEEIEEGQYYLVRDENTDFYIEEISELYQK